MKTEARQSTSREDSVSGLKYVDRLQTFKCQAFQRVAGLKIPKCLTLRNIAGLKTSLCVTLAVFTIDFFTIKTNYMKNLNVPYTLELHQAYVTRRNSPKKYVGTQKT